MKTALLRRHWGKIILAAFLLSAAVWLWYAHRHDLTREDIVEYGEKLPVGGFLAAFAILPLLGFPISILLVLAGIRFGLAGGMGVTALGMVIHHLAAFYLAHRGFRQRLTRKLESMGHRIPSVGRRPVLFTTLFAAVHGPPYTAKLYLLALTDIPFRIYFWAGAPVYILFAAIPVAAGSAVMRFDPTWLYGLITLIAVLSLTALWLRQKKSR